MIQPVSFVNAHIEAINLQSSASAAKPYRVHQARKVLLKHSWMNKTYEIVVYWSEQDGQFRAEVPELPDNITNRANRGQPLRSASEVIDAYFAKKREAVTRFPDPKAGKRST